MQLRDPLQCADFENLIKSYELKCDKNYTINFSDFIANLFVQTENQIN
jgi:hypothetical protein